MTNILCSAGIVIISYHSIVLVILFIFFSQGVEKEVDGKKKREEMKDRYTVNASQFLMKKEETIRSTNTKHKCVCMDVSIYKQQIIVFSINLKLTIQTHI